MSSFSSPPPLTIPFRFRRKSSSASTHVSVDNQIRSLGDAATSSSPLLSSSPLQTPLHLTRPYECMEWKADDYLDELDEVIYDPRNEVEDITCPWSCHPTAPPLPYIHRPFPSLMTKIAASILQSNTPPSHNPSPSSLAPQTTYFYPQGDSAIADDCEEYDLESMDIHIRETYFATSAERGRWLSSPIASRVRSQAISPMHAHSSPVKKLADASPLRERLPKHKRRCSVERQISTSPSENRDEDACSSSSLPPSSPLSSPMSNISFLGDDYKDDSVGDPHSNSVDCYSFTGTPELSISSTTCPSPVESTRTPTPYDAPADVPLLHPINLPGSVISRQLSPCSGHSPRPMDIHIHAPGATSFEPDNIPSPLSPFKLDLLEEEPLKLPLSDTVNKPYPGERTTIPGATVDAAWSQDKPSCIQSLSVNFNHELLDVSLDTVGGSGSNTGPKKRRESPTSNPGARQTKKRAIVRSRSPPSDAKGSRGAEGHTSNCLEPPSKKSTLSSCRDDSKSYGAKYLPRRGRIPKVERRLRPPLRPVVEGCDSCPGDKKTPTDHAQLQQPTPGFPTTVVPMAVDVEFRVSLTGMLIEGLATSRATSMDSAALYLVLTQAHPYLVTERSREELLVDIAAVLEAGRARCGMFERVDSSGERSRHKALESRWFYVPELDEDPERASLIRAIMPRQKRTETKKYKQYYYRPLDKISRWDPEDAP